CTWCRVPPGEFSPVSLNPRISIQVVVRDDTLYTSRPSAQGDSPCEIFLTNAQSDRQLSTD
ncbi:hypothetical protein ACTHIT_005071, partial [Escherichia coli]